MKRFKQFFIVGLLGIGILMSTNLYSLSHNIPNLPLQQNDDKKEKKKSESKDDKKEKKKTYRWSYKYQQPNDFIFSEFHKKNKL